MENQNPNNPYQAQPAAAYRAHTTYVDESPLSIGGYLVMMLVSVIPIVNLVMLFVWGFGSSNLNRKNYARAALIILAVGIVVGILVPTLISISTFSWIPHR